jgi:putative ABC transport system permease protein
VPGLFDPVEIRAQDPAGPYVAPMVALRQGIYPHGANEIAPADAVSKH